MSRPGHVRAQTTRALVDVSLERVRQDEKFGGYERSLPPLLWTAVLGEEFGEVCEAILEGDVDGLRNELVQVAAVAVAAIEQIDRGEWVDS